MNDFLKRLGVAFNKEIFASNNTGPKTRSVISDRPAWIKTKSIEPWQFSPTNEMKNVFRIPRATQFFNAAYAMIKIKRSASLNARGDFDLMTNDELNILLDERELHNTLDVRTLVIDLVRKMQQDEIEKIFWEHLPKLNHESIKGYFYMSRS